MYYVLLQRIKDKKNRMLINEFNLEMEIDFSRSLQPEFILLLLFHLLFYTLQISLNLFPDIQKLCSKKPIKKNVMRSRKKSSSSS